MSVAQKCSEIGDWRGRLEIGDWRLEIRDWRLEIGDWRFRMGDWRLSILDKIIDVESLVKKY